MRRYRVGVGIVAVSACVGAGCAASAATAAPHAKAGPALSVDVSAGRHPISPDIYGMNFANPSLAHELHLADDRWGGNATSRYNYTNNFTNTANDYYFENVKYRSLDTLVGRDLKAHVQPLVTVPMLGWVAKKSPTSHPFFCGFKVSKYGPQQDTDPYDRNCGNGVKVGGGNVTGNSPSDTSFAAGPSWDQAMVRHLVAKFRRANKGGIQTYELDNEPSLWNSTHRDVHPKPLTYGELWSRSKATAAAIRQADPTATVEGPSDWGWCAYFFSPADDPQSCADGPDRKSHGDLPFAAWYLKQFAAQARKTGHRWLKYFDEHYYPQANGVALAPAGNASTQALRLRSTRSLWDPTYTDESWTKDIGLGPVMLIPRMRQWVQKYYPGTKLAIGEYNWGGLESMNGALAQADVLGIFGRERLDRAMLWAPPTSGQPGAFAFRIYRNYDGAGSEFGNVGVQATSGDQSELAVYAAQRSSDHATTIVVINKTGQALSANLTLNGVTASSAKVYSYSSQDLNHIVPGPAATIVGGRVSHTYPASSITLFVVG